MCQTAEPKFCHYIPITTITEQRILEYQLSLDHREVYGHTLIRLKKNVLRSKLLCWDTHSKRKENMLISSKVFSNFDIWGASLDSWMEVFPLFNVEAYSSKGQKTQNLKYLTSWLVLVLSVAESPIAVTCAQLPASHIISYHSEECHS